MPPKIRNPDDVRSSVSLQCLFLNTICSCSVWIPISSISLRNFWATNCSWLGPALNWTPWSPNSNCWKKFSWTIIGHCQKLLSTLLIRQFHTKHFQLLRTKSKYIYRPYFLIPLFVTTTPWPTNPMSDFYSLFSYLLFTDKPYFLFLLSSDNQLPFLLLNIVSSPLPSTNNNTPWLLSRPMLIISYWTFIVNNQILLPPLPSLMLTPRHVATWMYKCKIYYLGPC